MASPGAFFQFGTPMIFGGRKKSGNRPTIPRRFYRRSGSVDVLWVTARQAGDNRAAHFGGNFADGSEISLADDRKSRFNDIDIESLKLASHLHLLAQVHRGPRTLLAIAQCRIKNYYFLWHNR